MVYAQDGDRPTRNVPTSKAERATFVLSNQDILALGRWACVIEEHYGYPMDMEWAKDGESGELFILQARPETVQSRKEASAFWSYRIKSKGRKLVSGLSIGDAVVAGRVCLIDNPRDIGRFVDGAILVTQTTDPDWVPIMKRAAAIVTDHGGRTSHAAIVSRELGLPAIVGTGDATRILHDEQAVTASCAEGDEVSSMRAPPTSRSRSSTSQAYRRRAPRSCSIWPIPRQLSAGGGFPLTASASRAWNSW
jgi:pyruvate,water dikinase